MISLCRRVLLLALAAALVPATCVTARAQTFGESILDTFETVTPDGGNPNGVIQASDGNFYTTTYYGGANNSGEDGEGAGTVLRISPSGLITVLYTFCNFSPCTEPTNPDGGLIQGTDGNLYGTGSAGGLYNQGAVFKITLAGVMTTIYDFCPKSGCADGSLPFGTMIQGTDGALYGRSLFGGPGNGGAIFKVTTSGAESVFYGTSGLSLKATPVQGSDGSFYGTAGGGANGGGQIYKLTPTGAFTTIYNFCSVGGTACTDGSQPGYSTLAEGPDGDFYGTTYAGGTGTQYGYTAGAGTFFKVTTAGKLTTLYNFCSMASCADGSTPYSGPTLGSDGAYYGFTATGGGPEQQGTFYRQTGTTFDTLWQYCQNATDSCNDIEQPQLQTVQGSDGAFYATSGLYSINRNGYPGAFFKMVDLQGLPAPIVLTLSSGTVGKGSTFTLGYKVVNATSDTLKQCRASSNGSFTGWNGIVTASPSNQIVTLTAPASSTGLFTLALTCGGVESSSINVVVNNGAAGNTTTTLAASPNPAAVGKAVTFTATVTQASGSTKPSGTISFYYGSILLGTAGLNGGTASLAVATTGLPVGSYVVTASYPLTGNFNASSGTTTLAVAADATNTQLVITPNTLTPPTAVSFKATVTRTGGAQGVPTGSVSFYVGTVLLATEALNASGVATYGLASTSGLPAGTYTLTAKYLGDASDGVSTSPGENVVVK